MKARCGFTLFEMLISLSLMSVAITIAYAGMHQGSLLRTAGQSEAEQDRYVRAILRGFETMVMNASIPREQTTGNAWDIESPTDAAVINVVPRYNGSLSRELNIDCGIWGNEQFLAVCLEPTVDPADHKADHMCCAVSVLAHMPNGIFAVPQRISGATIDASSIKPDLAKSKDLAWFDAVIRRSDSHSNMAMVDPHYRQTADTHCSIRIRYYDGQSWHGTWDTIDRGDNPQAIELNLTRKGRSGERVYRTIAIPPKRGERGTT